MSSVTVPKKKRKEYKIPTEKRHDVTDTDKGYLCNSVVGVTPALTMSTPRDRRAERDYPPHDTHASSRQPIPTTRSWPVVNPQRLHLHDDLLRCALGLRPFSSAIRRK